jgi:hypothetical protein
MSYPDFGTKPIRCAKRGCKWRGFETDLKAGPTQGIATKNVCPSCGGDSYWFMTNREVTRWENEKRNAGVKAVDSQSDHPSDASGESSA